MIELDRIEILCPSRHSGLDPESMNTVIVQLAPQRSFPAFAGMT
jgi:hypothetical protein